MNNQLTLSGVRMSAILVRVCLSAHVRSVSIPPGLYLCGDCSSCHRLDTPYGSHDSSSRAYVCGINHQTLRSFVSCPLGGGI